MSSKKQIRENFRNVCLQRDNNSCRVYGAKNCHLDVHHIVDRHDMPNGGYVLENGISLCPECHLKAEAWHQNLVVPSGFLPQELFALIGSDLDAAYEASHLLSMPVQNK